MPVSHVVLLQVALKCGEVQQAAATIDSKSKLLLFLRLKTTTQSHLRSLSPSLAAGHLPQDCEQNNYQKHIMSAKSNGNANVGQSDEDVRMYISAAEAQCDEVKTFLKQWLPSYSQPDDIEIVDNIPFTKHGKFLLLLSAHHFVFVLICVVVCLQSLPSFSISR